MKVKMKDNDIIKLIIYDCESRVSTVSLTRCTNGQKHEKLRGNIENYMNKDFQHVSYKTGNSRFFFILKV